MSSTDWVVFDYERDMFTQMLQIGTTIECQTYPLPVRNAIVESMLLHLRILVDILLSRGAEGDDIKLTDLLPSFTSPLIAQLRTAYGSRKKIGTPCYEINKRLAHPTTIRSSSYNYDHVLKALGAILCPLLEEIAAARHA